MVVVALGFGARVAVGHPNHSLRGDRWVKIAVQPDGVRVVYSVSFGPLAALRARVDMDGDRDRQVDPEEVAVWSNGMVGRISSSTRWELDGRLAAPSWETPSLEGVEGPLRTDPFTFEITGPVAIAPGREQRLVLEDRVLVRYLDRTTFTAVVTPPATLVAAGPRRWPRSVESTVMLAEIPGEASVRTFAVRFRTPAPPPKPWGARAWWALGGVAAIAASVASLVVARVARRARARRSR